MGLIKKRITPKISLCFLLLNLSCVWIRLNSNYLHWQTRLVSVLWPVSVRSVWVGGWVCGGGGGRVLLYVLPLKNWNWNHKARSWGSHSTCEHLSKNCKHISISLYLRGTLGQNIFFLLKGETREDEASHEWVYQSRHFSSSKRRSGNSARGHRQCLVSRQKAPRVRLAFWKQILHNRRTWNLSPSNTSACGHSHANNKN